MPGPSRPAPSRRARRRGRRRHVPARPDGPGQAAAHGDQDGRAPAGTGQPVRPHAPFSARELGTGDHSRTSTPSRRPRGSTSRPRPLVLSLPDTGGRYYAMPIYDAWTTAFATLGARTTGTRAREYVLAGSRLAGAPARRDGGRAGADLTGLDPRPPPLGRVPPTTRRSAACSSRSGSPRSAGGPATRGPTTSRPLPPPAVAPSPVAQVPGWTRRSTSAGWHVC